LRLVSKLSSIFHHWLALPPKMRAIQAVIAACVAAAVGAILIFGYALLILAPNLPSIDALTTYQPKIPLRVYTADNVLIGEFGEERRDFVPIAGNAGQHEERDHRDRRQ
jgi:penicillin-binding protein 1A